MRDGTAAGADLAEFVAFELVSRQNVL